MEDAAHRQFVVSANLKLVVSFEDNHYRVAQSE